MAEDNTTEGALTLTKLEQKSELPWIFQVPFISFMLFGLKRIWQERIVLVVQLVTMLLIITIFSSIYQVTPFEELSDEIHITASLMIWYVLTTELMLFLCGGHCYKEIKGDINGGQFSSTVQQPKSYLRVKFWTYLGSNLLRIVFFTVFGMLLAYYLADMFPYSGLHFFMWLITLIIGSLIYFLMVFMVSLTEVWGAYSNAVMWINQKMLFLFGGLFLPIQIYPEWMQSLAWWTPYPALLNVPAMMAFQPSLDTMVSYFLHQLVWFVVMLLAAIYLQSRAYHCILNRGY